MNLDEKIREKQQINGKLSGPKHTGTDAEHSRTLTEQFTHATIFLQSFQQQEQHEEGLKISTFPIRQFVEKV